MTWKVTGGVAAQPEVPVVLFGFGRNDGWFEARILTGSERVISSPSTTQTTVEDRVFNVSVVGQIAQDYLLEIEIQPRTQDSETPSVTITGGGGLTLDGLVLRSQENNVFETVLIKTPQRTLQLLARALIRDSGTPAQVFAEFATGSLAKSCEDSVNDRIENATTAMLPIFTNYSASHAGGSYNRNPDCWAYDLRQAMTCISPWNSNAANRKAGVALTKRHITNAAHYEYPVGTTVRFVTADNVTVTRAIIGKRRHPAYPSSLADITIYLLDSDLPDSITPCKLLPENWENYFPTGVENIAALCLDQEEKALVTDLRLLQGSRAYFKYPDTANEQILYESKILGDSGNPSFLIINGELACITLWTYGGAGSGTFLTPEIATMSQMISDLDTAASVSTGYTIQTVDLSGFTDFS